ncbi:histidine phosphatase family protein [Actinocorallia populi]|uniref:histidine phosphatase family protein n=1 Tax=Actinocorallia populi TaxID=2079200 RepID=UPI000D090197|nr:histidine phosphatase family protein [Actinocorallia populi]
MELILIRHGESTGNAARRAALRAGAEVIDVPERDPDVPLSPHGREQAESLGRFLAGLEPPELVVSSPYARALETVRLATGRADVRLDERLRDRDMGVFERLTPAGIRARFPEEWRRQRELGKFYFRPPGGESWADIALRLRSFLRDLPAGGRVLVSTHDAVILVFAYLLEGLSEAELMELERTRLANCSVSLWRDGERLVFNEVSHLE